jgi:monovalent cation:H+ antiporter-2, CPA2 family
LSSRLSIRYSFIVGFLFAHIGEFSFVLAKSGAAEGLMTPYLFQLFLDVSILSMALVPPVSLLAEPLARLVNKLPLPLTLKAGWGQLSQPPQIKKKDHVIIVGFGIPGRNLAHSLREAEIPYVVIEMNPDTVKTQKGHGEPIFYGDASHESILFHAGITHAKAVAVVVNDAASAFRIVENARKINPSLYIIVRCQRVQEMKLFVEAGASDVIPDEFGTSIEIFTRVLKLLKVEPENIDRLISEMRLEGYELLRQEFLEPYALAEARDVLGHYRLKSIPLPSSSDLVGMTIEQSGLKRECGVSILLIKRKGATISNILAQTVLEADDILVLMGSRESLNKADRYLKDHEKNNGGLTYFSKTDTPR